MANTQELNIICILLTSLNGKIAFHSKESSKERRDQQFTCEKDFERMRQLVSQCDVVFHGAKSIETERGAFSVSHLTQKASEPEWIIFSKDRNLEFKSPFWNQTNIPKSLCTLTPFKLNESPQFNVDVQTFSFGKLTCYFGNMQGLAKYLISKNKLKAALLGGGKLNTFFWEHNLVQELYLTISPFVIGGENVPSFVEGNNFFVNKLKLVNCEQEDGFVYLNYSSFLRI